LWLDAAGFKGHIAAVIEEEVEPADTDHEKEHQEPRARWGVIASVLVHVPLVALLIFGLPKIQPKPAEDESVKVELVPPPEEKKPEEKKAEEKPKEEEKPQEQTKAEPPPPPPPPPPPAENVPEQAKPMPIPTLRSVTEFGDKNSGPQKSTTGNSSEGEVKPAEAAPQHDAEPDQPLDATAEEKPPTETPPAAPVPDDVKLPETTVTDVSPERNAPLADMSGEALTSIEQVKPPKPKPSETSEPEPAKDNLKVAKTLFSQNDSEDPIARTLIDGMSRKQRIGELCSTELRQQLVHSSPSFAPTLLPKQGLSSGTILDLEAAFRTSENWYDISLRCEVDQNATKVVSFAFRVGSAVPRSQWKSRGFPY
jgi:hypothetical protein